jgi:hypothetical protein
MRLAVRHCGTTCAREPGRRVVIGWQLGRRSLSLAKQHGVAVGVRYLRLAAERVRRVTYPGDFHAGRVEHADDGIEVIEVKVEQQRQPRDAERRLCRRQQDSVPVVMQGRPR